MSNEGRGTGPRRVPNVRGGSPATSFKDTFAPYQAHVYVIAPVTTP